MLELTASWLEIALIYLGVIITPVVIGLMSKLSERITAVNDEARLNRKRIKGGYVWTEKLWNMKGETDQLRQKLMNLLAQNKTSDPSAVIDAIDSCNRILDQLTGLMMMKEPDDE